MRKASLLLVCLVLLTILVGHAASIGLLAADPELPYAAALPYVVNDLVPETPEVPAPDLYTCAGEVADTAWLYEAFGAVAWQPRDGVRLMVLRCVEGPSALVVHVKDEAGNPLENVTVVRYWPDAPPLAEELQWDGTYNRGVYGSTNVEGNIGFPMGWGDYYFPPDQTGVSAIWVAGADSHLLTGLGMLGGTNHIHLDSDWTLSAAQVRSLPAHSRDFTPGAVVHYADLGYSEPVPIVSWPVLVP